MNGNTAWRWGGRLALLILSWAAAAPARADEPKELTDEQRVELKRQALELNQQAERLYQDGEYAAAVERMEKVLKLTRRLYPADKYPDGDADLATSLNNLAFLLQAQGMYGKAEPLFREALDMYKRLDTPDLFPDGSPDLAAGLNNLGNLLRARGELAEAEPYLRDGLTMCQALYPTRRYPKGQPDLAASLNNLGCLLAARGEYAKAEPFYRDAVDMCKRLYPTAKYPAGHSELAGSLNSLGTLLLSRGEYAKAEAVLRDSLAMHRSLYPPEKYPDGHPDLAQSLNNLGALLRTRGEFDKAEPLYRESVEMYGKLYPPEKYPSGHPDLAMSLNSLGELLQAREEYAEAESRLLDSLKMRRRLYPADKYPDGHPDLAVSLHNVGMLLRARGEYDKAEEYLRDAVKVYRRLYPPDRYPDGHPDLATGLSALGFVLDAGGHYRKAADAYAEGTAMYDRLTTAFAESGAEAEALNLAASLPATRDIFLAASRRAEGADPARDYAVLWPGKAAIVRVLGRRRGLARAAAAADGKARGKLTQLLAARQDLARLIVAPARPGDADRDGLLRDLTDRKERLEKELAALLPPSERKEGSVANLLDRLPGHAAFVDLYWYSDWNMKTQQWDGEHCAAFVLRRGQGIRRIELSDGAALRKDLKEWRQVIDGGLASDAAGRLRKGLWEPIAGALGDGVDTVYVCPDGDLAAMPWPALPRSKEGHVLLEDYAFAVVPSGSLLLEQLIHAAPADDGAGVLLAVGGVRYDRAGASPDKAGKPWPDLPATDRERAAVAAWARNRSGVSEVVERVGADVDVARVLDDLPKARWAHLATHGFFAAEDAQERTHLFRPDDFLSGVNSLGGQFRIGAAARNPLTQSGLVLAGANQPTDTDTGLLTGEAIAGLDLDKLDLAVLSACRTGLGEQSTGEGVFGLQRAFHIAGAKNVVASLWTVDDDATAALMNLFYYHLWEKGEPPLEALRHAQLELYRKPEGVPALARGRGAADWDEAVRVVTKPPADPKAAPARPAAVRDWAAFVLSGAGR